MQSSYMKKLNFLLAIELLVTVSILPSCILLTSGCGNSLSIDKSYVCEFEDILNQRAFAAIIESVDPESYKKAIMENRSSDNVLDGYTNPPLGKSPQLEEDLLERAKELKCMDERLMESKKNLVSALEMDKQAVGELISLLSYGDTSEEMERRLDVVFDLFEEAKIKVERAKSLVDQFKKENNID